MPKPTYETALIVGAGSGLSASLARLLAGEGLRVALAARNSEKLAPLCAETGAKAFACEATDPGHVAHFVIDGAIRNPGRVEPPDRPDSMLDPDAIAASYLHVLQQPRSAWTWEVELRPWVERF